MHLSIRKKNPDLLFLTEDDYLNPISWHILGVWARAVAHICARVCKRERVDIVRAFYSAAHETMMYDAQKAARNGRAVHVDTGVGPPDDFYELLKREKNRAHEYNGGRVYFTIDWITCSETMRKNRLSKKRGTRFDLVLIESEHYFNAVKVIEERMKQEWKNHLPITVYTNEGNEDTNLGKLRGSRSKNLLFIGAWAARQHIRLLTTTPT